MPNSSPVQRRHERVPVEVKVRISTIDPETDPRTGKPYFRTSEETCANVSRGGTFVVTGDPVAPGQRLLLEIDIPDGSVIQTIGRVAWTRCVMEPSGRATSSGFGIEFMGGSPEHLSKLQAFLDREEEPVSAGSAGDPGSGQDPSERSGWRKPSAARRGGA